MSACDGLAELREGNRKTRQSDINRSFPIPVHDLVAMRLWHEIGSFGRPRNRDRVAAAVTALGLTGFEDLPHRRAAYRDQRPHHGGSPRSRHASGGRA